MSLDKSIEHGRDHRKQYHGARAVDRSCRPHGSCPWCRGNRLHNSKVKELDAKEQMNEKASVYTIETDRSIGKQFQADK